MHCDPAETGRLGEKMKELIADQGVVLMGEAAKAYVTYKYVELFVLLVVVGLFGYGLYRTMKSL